MSFKASKGTRKKEHKSSESSTDELDEEEKIIIKIKKGFRKYKGKLPFKWFDCGKIGHFASKFPYPKGEDSDDENDYNHK